MRTWANTESDESLSSGTTNMRHSMTLSSVNMLTLNNHVFLLDNASPRSTGKLRQKLFRRSRQFFAGINSRVGYIETAQCVQVSLFLHYLIIPPRQGSASQNRC